MQSWVEYYFMTLFYICIILWCLFELCNCVKTKCKKKSGKRTSSSNNQGLPSYEEALAQMQASASPPPAYEEVTHNFS